MPSTYDFYGNDVTDAIDKASEKLDASYEQLDIEIVTTGSAGIFGFARKEAHIRVSPKKQKESNPDDPYGVSGIVAESLTTAGGNRKGSHKTTKSAKTVKVDVGQVQAKEIAPPSAPEKTSDIPEEDLLPQEIDILKKELLNIVAQMGFPATVETTVSGRNVELILHGEHEAELVGEEGRVLDSLQYLLRKIAGRKIGGSVRLNLDVGNYRTHRLVEMKELAKELAEQVKKDGKTQAIPALSPVERREVHLLLQGDSDIRSRSVGEGMFKKVLIFKPDSGKGGRKPSRSRRRSLKNPKES